MRGDSLGGFGVLYTWQRRGDQAWGVRFGVLSEEERVRLRHGLERILNGRLTLLARWQVSRFLARVVETWPYASHPPGWLGYIGASAHLFAAVYNLLNDWDTQRRV